MSIYVPRQVRIANKIFNSTPASAVHLLEKQKAKLKEELELNNKSNDNDNGEETKTQEQTKKEDKNNSKTLIEDKEKDDEETNNSLVNTNTGEKPKKTRGTKRKKEGRRPSKDSIYGNYHLYYGYRKEKGALDPRLSYFKKEWFEGKHCLDIGCNDGTISISIVKVFKCRSMRGIDIDSKLIEYAIAGSRRFITSMQKEQPQQEIPKIMFQAGNILEIDLPIRYDVILCLSVIKWIQLHWGDEGAKSLFKKIYQGLNVGGLFVLEPQPWKSYQKKRKEIKEFRSVEIQLKPEKFIEYLTGPEIGFMLYENIEVDDDNADKRGFARPIYVFKKVK